MNTTPRDWLKEKRIKLDLNQAQIARRVGMSVCNYNRIEHGLRNPSVQNAKKIAAVMGFNWTEFFKE